MTWQLTEGTLSVFITLIWAPSDKKATEHQSNFMFVLATGLMAWHFWLYAQPGDSSEVCVQKDPESWNLQQMNEGEARPDYPWLQLGMCLLL